jgi:hypothetical protein
MTDRHANAGTARDTRPLLVDEMAGGYVLFGSAGAAATSIPLTISGLTLEESGPGIPVALPCELGGIAVSFMAATEPDGPVTLTFQKRAYGSDTWESPATFNAGVS